MSKTITFTRFFLKGHQRAGGPTYFVEQIYNSIYKKGDWSDAPGSEDKYVMDLDTNITGIKHHTIRSGHRWKVGDQFSPRVWSGKPYASKQIIIALDIEIKQIYNFDIDENGIISVNGKYTHEYPGIDRLIAKNDGLGFIDFYHWIIEPCFVKRVTFSGQIICWADIDVVGYLSGSS